MRHLVAAVLVIVAALGCSKKTEEIPAVASASASAAPAPPEPTASASVAPVPTPVRVVDTKADTDAIKKCCSALSAAADKAPPADKGLYTTAAATCGSLAGMVASGRTTRAAALTSLRAALKGGALPGGC